MLREKRLLAPLLVVLCSLTFVVRGGDAEECVVEAINGGKVMLAAEMNFSCKDYQSNLEQRVNTEGSEVRVTYTPPNSRHGPRRIVAIVPARSDLLAGWDTLFELRTGRSTNPAPGVIHSHLDFADNRAASAWLSKRLEIKCTLVFESPVDTQSDVKEFKWFLVLDLGITCDQFLDQGDFFPTSPLILTSATYNTSSGPRLLRYGVRRLFNYLLWLQMTRHEKFASEGVVYYQSFPVPAFVPKMVKSHVSGMIPSSMMDERWYANSLRVYNQNRLFLVSFAIEYFEKYIMYEFHAAALFGENFEHVYDSHVLSAVKEHTPLAIEFEKSNDLLLGRFPVEMDDDENKRLFSEILEHVQNNMDTVKAFHRDSEIHFRFALPADYLGGLSWLNMATCNELGDPEREPGPYESKDYHSGSQRTRRNSEVSAPTTSNAAKTKRITQRSPRKSTLQNPKTFALQNPEESAHQSPRKLPQQSPGKLPQQSPRKLPQQSPRKLPQQSPGKSPLQNSKESALQNPEESSQESPRKSPLQNPRKLLRNTPE